MLNKSSLLRLLPIFASLLAVRPATANALFEARDIDRDRAIAIARPYGENKYDLLILKQIPGKRQCWQEEGSNPTTVVPLLLDFDFTGSCERSTDSNGYSMRVGGEDLGLDYLLRIVERDGELWLVGTHRKDRTDVAIGRTHGLKQGFLKIDLEPGWRFANRVYQGKTLGHVYLTGDRDVLQASLPPTTDPLRTDPPTAAAATSPTTSPSPSEDRQSDSSLSPEPIQEITFSAIPDSSNPPQAFPPADSERPLQTEPSSSGRSLPPLPVPPRPLSSAPGATKSEPSTSFSDLPPLPPPPSAANPPTASGNGRKPLGDILNLSPSTNPTDSETPDPAQRVPQPPSLNSGSRTAAPPPLAAQPVLPRQASYRVLVNPGSQQAEIRSRYPDAFTTTYQGRSLLQIGRFSTQENARRVLGDLEGLGLRGIIAQ